jgi:Astacin (Peptidase family M12A)
VTEIDKLYEALSKIAETANAVVSHRHGVISHCHGHRRLGDGDGHDRGEMPSCSIKMLPERLRVEAAQTAIRRNPANGVGFASITGASRAFGIEPQRIAVMVQKYWGPQQRQLTVSFMEQPAEELRKRILSHMNAWSSRCGISFIETGGVGQVRISLRGSGYWSYLGTDILHIPQNRPTMNLQGFSMSTPEREYHRVVRHETGHTLGFPHEHMRRELVARIDPQKAYAYFLETQGWDQTTVDQQVLTPLDQASIMGTPPDETSIMCYQLPGEITKDGGPIEGGLDINQTDYGFAARIYPKPGAPHQQADAYQQAGPDADDWHENEDVDVASLALA